MRRGRCHAGSSLDGQRKAGAKLRPSAFRKAMSSEPAARYSHSCHATNVCNGAVHDHADPRPHSRGNARQLRRGAGTGARRRSPRRADRTSSPSSRERRPRPAALFQGAVPPAGRTGEAAGLGAAPQAQGRRDVRGPRCRRQGRRDQAHHPAAQPARLPGRGAAGAERARAHAMVLPALRRRTCRPAARSCCSTAAGTTAPASSA